MNKQSYQLSKATQAFILDFMNKLVLRDNCPTESEFKKMQPIGKDKDGTIVVKCDRYEADR